MAVTAAPTYRDLYLFVAGERRNADGRSAIPVINPATGAEIGRLPAASDDDLHAALEAAARGFERWRNLSPLGRSQVLRGAAELLRQRSSEIARTMTLEQGKPLAESTGELIATAEIFEWTAEEGRRLYGRVVPSRTPNIRQFTLRQPIGVVAAFTPWNFPALTPARKLAGALGAGCSIIIKPSEETPGTALALLEALLEAGLPEDVVSVVFGAPAHISEMLIASPIVRKISFTGSIPVGKHLARLAADGMKAATLELGGRSAFRPHGFSFTSESTMSSSPSSSATPRSSASATASRRRRRWRRSRTSGVASRSANSSATPWIAARASKPAERPLTAAASSTRRRC
jgi:succinate-semialdehyde dehydrogenase/glutarate-semialdehyde dehydrogenase